MLLPYTLEQYKQKEEKLKNHISFRIPGFQIKSKQESTLMKILSKVLFFIKNFQTTNTTTIYPKVYFPSEYCVPHKNGWDAVYYIGTLVHEFIHLSDRKRLWQLFNLLYLSPQIFAILAILSFSSLWWLCTLVFLLPIPSIGRAWIEFRGYRAEMAAFFYLTKIDNPNIAFYAEQFVKSNYYWIFPFRKYMIKQFNKSWEKIKTNKDIPKNLKEIRLILLT